MKMTFIFHLFYFLKFILLILEIERGGAEGEEENLMQTPS